MDILFLMVGGSALHMRAILVNTVSLHGCLNLTIQIVSTFVRLDSTDGSVVVDCILYATTQRLASMKISCTQMDATGVFARTPRLPLLSTSSGDHPGLEARAAKRLVIRSSKPNHI